MKAVFLDRDGVINELVFNSNTGEYEPPHDPDKLLIFPYVIDSLTALQNGGFELFLISNQPDYAKGKTTLEKLKNVHKRLDDILKKEGIIFREYYYCFHHPQGMVPEYSFMCKCRKPNSFFIMQAVSRFGVEPSVSWMVGDRDSDVLCGYNSGLKTVAIEYGLSSSYRGKVIPDYSVKNLEVAVNLILKANIK